mgnify:CR=1 FL=1
MEHETVNRWESCPFSARGWIWLALFLIVGAVPLCMYLRIVPISADVQEFWTGQTETFDFFSFYRARWTVLLAAVGLFGFLNLERSQSRSGYSFLLGIYAFFIVASTAFSERPWQAVDGAPGRYEGTAVLLAYVIIAYLALSQARCPTFSRKLLGATLAGGLIVCLVGLAQFLNHDPFRTLQGKHLVMPASAHNQVKSLEFNVTNGFIYGTLPNPNYTGSYITIIMAITFGGVWLGRGKWRWTLLPLHFLAYINWFGCRSRAGLLGGGLAIIFLLLMGRSRWRENLKLAGILFLSYVTIFFWMDYISLKTPNSHRLLDNFFSRPSHRMPIANDFKDLILATDSFDLVYSGSLMHCDYKKGNFEFRNQAGNVVTYELDGQQAKFPKNEFFGFTVAIATESKVVQITRLENTISLIHTKQGFMFIDDRMRPVRFRKVPKYGFEGREQWGTMRGFAWSRSLPLMWDALLMGYGPDMFLFHFPQDDYLEKLRAGIPLFMRFDKPHNMFLQIGINTGGLSLLAVLILFGKYLLQSVLIFWRARFEDAHEIYGVCIAAAIGGYLAAGMFNDSSLSVAPVFWALLGAGIGINMKLAERTSAVVGQPLVSGDSVE